MDYILQKTTELGVNEIIPFMANRSLIKLDNRKDKKIERWQKIVKEASEQSKREVVPKVNNFMQLSDLVNLKEYDMKFLCTVNENSQNIKKELSNISRSARILFVIGPEGGFTKEEEITLIENGFISLSLGSSVLRTETASIFIMSVVRYLDME
jgi:16S rRNA (uracil1498-N3)-methyltransferase